MRLSGELEATREAMKRLLMNGAGDVAPTQRPTQARLSKPGELKHPNAIAAQKAEAKIIELLETSPGLKISEIAKATSSKTTTTTERLKRLRAKGLATNDGGEWRASA